MSQSGVKADFGKRGAQWCLLFFLIVVPVQAQAVMGVTLKAGLPGVGADLTVPLIDDRLNLRAGYNWLVLKPSRTIDNINYDADIDFQSVPLLLDFHPFRGGFRITAGAFYNMNEVDLFATVPAGTVVGNTTVPATTVLQGNLEWKNDFAPYLGIGYGNAALADTEGSWELGFSLDLGVFYQGDPDLTLTDLTGTVSAADLAAEEAQAEDDLDITKFFPVLTLGIHIRF